MTDRSFPSDLFERYWNTVRNSEEEENEESSVNHENIFQNVLSALATQDELFLTNHGQEDTSEETTITLNWLVLALTGSEEEIEDSTKPDKNSVNYEWWIGLRLIHLLLPKLSPFEIHSVANQSIVFSEKSRTHYVICLLLCATSIKQCPCPIENRWKRWQSVVCETIRNFQNYRDDRGDLFGLLWVDHLVPALVHAISQLPKEAQHAALLSALIGTTSCIVFEWERDRSIQTTSSLRLGTALRRIVQSISDHDETWVWLNPWRIHDFEKLAFNREEEEEEEDDDDEETSVFHDKIEWWATCADSLEVVAEMDTIWDHDGISFLAWRSFQGRSQALSSSYIWKIWFPHVETLLRMLETDPINDTLPLKFLEEILEVIPEQSISSFNKKINLPDSPLGTFQLLSNRLLRRKPDGGLEEQQKFKAQMDYVVSLMKSLLARYTPKQQIEIVKCLLNYCPYPGLQAKFLDFLRPLIFVKDAESATLLWDYIGSFISALSKHINTVTGKVTNADDLIDNVEVYVGAITMVQLFALVENRLPNQIGQLPMRDFQLVLETKIECWMKDNTTNPPDNFYRLNLLEGSLKQAVDAME